MSNLKEYFYKNKISCKYFLFLISVLSIVTYVLISKQITIGIYYWDIFLYLNNGMTFTGTHLGDTMYLSPFLSFLYSLFFRMGFINETIVFIICGIFYILGSIGFYLILTFRFKPWESLVGTLIYSTSNIVLIWSVTGALDVPAISLCIWTIYLTLLSIKKDSRIFYISFPIAMLAFLTRFTSGLIILPIFGMILFNYEKIKPKNIIIGIFIGCLIYIPFMINFNLNVGSFFPFIEQLSSSSSGTVSNINPGFNLDIFYYLKFMPQYLSSFSASNYNDIINPSNSNATILSYILLTILITILIIYPCKIIKSIKEIEDKKRIFYLMSSINILLILIAIITYSHIPYIYHELFLIVLILTLSFILKRINIKYIDLDFSFLLFFLSFFIMHSAHPVKVDRYFITMIPTIAYTITLGIHEISNFKIKTKENYDISKIISIFLIICILFSTSMYLYHIPTEVMEVKIEKTTTQWLINNDPNILDKKIASDRGPAFTWYFKKYVFTRVYNNETKKYFNNLIIKTKPDYYIQTKENNPFNIENYTEIATINSTHIYKLNNTN